MRSVTEIVSAQQIGNTQLSAQPSTTTRPQTSEPTEQQRDSTAYFFLRLRSVYGAEYLRHFPDDESVRLAKREWFRQIGQYDRQAIDEMFDFVKTERMRGSNEYLWLDIGNVLAIKGASWRHAAQSRTVDDLRAAGDLPPVLALEDKTAAEARQKRNRERMAAMRAELRI